MTKKQDIIPKLENGKEFLLIFTTEGISNIYKIRGGMLKKRAKLEIASLDFRSKSQK